MALPPPVVRLPETSPPGKAQRTGLGGFPSPLTRGCCRASAPGLLCSGVRWVARPLRGSCGGFCGLLGGGLRPLWV